MTKVIRTDRSRIITGQRCLRARWLEYNEAGTGITSARKPLPLAVGSAVHEGLAVLLRLGQEVLTENPHYDEAHRSAALSFSRIEELAVAAALADFAQFASALDAEQADATGLADGAYTPEQLAALRSDYDRYLFAEQSALVEALVRAYSRRRLRPLLEEFEVLEVEREGEWELYHNLETASQAQARGAEIYNIGAADADDWEIRFMSRPDALLRQRSTGALLLQSFKTAAAWDVRKARDVEHDMQGLSEGVEVERRLADWWALIHTGEWSERDPSIGPGHPADFAYLDRIYRYLRSLPAPPRILAIRYEFLLKGERWRDRDLAVRFGFDARSQKSHLVRGYLNAGMTAGDAQWNWSWDYLKLDGSGRSNLYYKTWRAAPVWQSMPIREWIDRLDAAAPLVASDADASGFVSQSLGYSCPAQSTGTTETHPLDAVLLPAVLVYRNDDDLRDWIEQTEAAEQRVAESAAAVAASADEGERRSLLNQHFPQSRHSCIYPSPCQFEKICYGGEDIRRDPLATGLFKSRTPNHPAERGMESDTRASKL